MDKERFLIRMAGKLGMNSAPLWALRALRDLSAFGGESFPVITVVLVSVSAPPVIHWALSAIADLSALMSIAL